MKVWRWFCRALLVVGAIHLAAPAYGAMPDLTREQQLQLLQQMSPAERESLLRSLQGGAPSAKSGPGPAEDAASPEPATPAAEVTERAAPKPPRLKAADTILIRFRRELPSGEEAAKEPRIGPEVKNGEAAESETAMPDQKLIVLDQFGTITLEKAGRIVLKGLNEAEAAERIEAEPAYKGLRVSVKLLPIEAPLKPFGYDIFAGAKKTFASPTDIPVPADYVVGPGDVVVVQLFGKDNTELALEVTRDGTILFPRIGPISVAGLKFSQLEQQIHNRVKRQLIGDQASVSLGKLRAIRIFVLGDVERPGSYAIGGLSTVTNALFASGGVTRIGSMRDVQVKRQGKIIAHFDMYDLLLRGDNSADVHLLPGDVIFVPPIGRTAGVAGRVRRPAIYELRDEKTVSDLIAMAGGLAPDAYLQVAKVERILDSRERTVLSVDLSKDDGRATELRDGDVVTVHKIVDDVEGAVRLVGHVRWPGNYEWKPDMRLSQLVPSLSVLMPDVDAHYLLIKRENPVDHSISFVDADLMAALAKPGTDADIALQSRDEVHVFGLREDRATFTKPLLKEAALRSGPEKLVPQVEIAGIVHHPGVYPMSSGMRVSDLLRAGGGLTDRAYTLEAELTRFTVMDGQERAQSRMSIDVSGVLKNDSAKDIALQPYDQLVIRRIPKWDEEGVIEIAGEVRFPGKYPIARDEKLSSVIQRTGGLTDDAYPKGAIFLRQSVREHEQKDLERLAAQLERDIALVSAQPPEIGVQKEQAVAQAQTLLRQLRATQATGRMVIKLDKIEKNGNYDIVVRAGDRLYVPKQPQEVTVLGEVHYPTSHVFERGLSLSDYVDRSGGVTERGNDSAIYVVRADGSVDVTGGWFHRDPKPEPGDTIIVPVKVERISKLKLFTDMTTAIFQIGVTIAALHAINVF